MTKVFVSGCYDIIHAGHIRYFKEARKFGDWLTVGFASDEVYSAWKGREPALPEASRRAILEELRCVDEVVMGQNNLIEPYMDWTGPIQWTKCDLLVVADDDKQFEAKRSWCLCHEIRITTIPRQPSDAESTSAIRERLAKPGSIIAANLARCDNDG